MSILCMSPYPLWDLGNILRELMRAIDRANRPDVYCQCGQEERFMGWSDYLPRREKSNFL